MKRAPARWLAALWVFASLALVPAQSADVSESSVKAVFLYKFAGYVEWPSAAFASPGAPFVIGVMRDDAVAAELEKLAPGRSIETHPLTVRRLRPGDPVRGVQLLFIAGDEPDRALVAAAQQQGALVVTDSPAGLAAGAEINFVLAEDHVGFEVSLAAAQRAGHRISSRMLAVARRVVQRGG
jgi:hypothetical protein